jgi:cytochrome c peroxidase
MKNYRFVLVLCFFAALVIASCAEEIIGEEDIVVDSGMDATDQQILAQTLNLPNGYYDYEGTATLPDFLNNQNVLNEDNTPNNNRITNAGATLGRVLFYDTKLSANNTISCASCHGKEVGFSDDNFLSLGFEGGFTGRNSMGIANARFYENGRFFWDERASTLENQVLMPIQDHIEMGMTLNELVTKLENEDYYDILFRDAFGDEAVTTNRISLALSQFVRSIVSFNSKYDQGLAQGRNGGNGGNLPNFTAQENQGLRLFNQLNCDNCHRTELFVGDQARNNGLDAVIKDNGLGNVTGNANDNGKFKVPSLRNIELTAPYMHDGRFATLLEVVEHYNSGVQLSLTLDNRLRNGNQPRRLNLSDADKAALVAFMKTLTDADLANEVKYSNPFK